MKKAIKTLAVISALSLVFSAFTACSVSDNEPETTISPITTTETQTETEQTTEAETTTEEAQTTTELEADSTETILNLIKNFPVGTAGSTAKSVDIAIRLLNFAEDCEDYSKLEDEIERFEDTLNDSEEEMFEQGFSEIDYVARKLIDGTSNTYDAYLESVTANYNKGNYSLEKYEKVFDLIADI